MEIERLSEISLDYNYFFIDLWGVVHNGVNLFQNVPEVLSELKENFVL